VFFPVHQLPHVSYCVVFQFISFMKFIKVYAEDKLNINVFENLKFGFTENI
jgi:hypothetical protein